MASILLVGTDEALLEGLAQTLGAAGHRAELTTSVAEATRRAADEAPLVVVAERALAAAGARGAADLRRVALAPGGAVVLFRTGGSAADGATGGNGHAPSTPPPAALPPSLQRTTLAELALPLERHRLVALVQSVEERARRTGRSKASSEPERGAGMRG
jgi:CheY-like chemotaxis protein